MKQTGKIIALLLVLMIVGTAGLAAGYYLGFDSGKNSTQTFYGSIDSIKGNVVQVTGLEINDINFRWRFDFSIAEDTKIIWHYMDLDASALKAGQTIAITFDGSIQETDPAGITHVNRITLLDDEIE